MSVKRPKELAKLLSSRKNILLVTGSLCDEVNFNGKNLLDYAAEISTKLNAPIAATANTALGLKTKGVTSLRKMWAAEVVNYMRYPWQDPIMEQKPEVLVFIGYPPAVASRLTAAVREGETVVLGNTYVAESTYSLPQSSSLRQWQQSLEQLIQSLTTAKS